MECLKYHLRKLIGCMLLELCVVHVTLEMFYSLHWLQSFLNVFQFLCRRSALIQYWPCLVMWLYCSGAVQIMSSNNDSVVRVFDCNTFSLIKSFSFPWAANVWCTFTFSCRYCQTALFLFEPIFYSSRLCS